MEDLGESIDIGSAEVKFGIRIGNNHGVTFTTPVVVIGISVEPSFLRTWMDQVIDDFGKKVEEIMALVNDKFYEYVDSHDLVAEMEV